MQIHNIRPIHKRKSKKRVGRGGKRGTYSGKGVKGQKSRSGTRKGQPIVRELIKRYPKLRGYRHNPKEKNQVSINLLILEDKFKSEDKITPKVLISRRLIRKIKGREPEVKILGRGEISKRLVIERCKVSGGAKKKIEEAGGEIKL